MSDHFNRTMNDNYARLLLWGQLVAAVAILGASGFIIVALIWTDLPREEYFFDCGLWIIGGTIIQLLCRILELLEINRMKSEREERQRA